jgi:hypothetical protein
MSIEEHWLLLKVRFIFFISRSIRKLSEFIPESITYHELVRLSYKVDRFGLTYLEKGLLK